MKGFVFTNLLDMVAEVFSPEMVERIIDGCDLETQGAYTTIGTYDHRELLQLVTRLSLETGITVSKLQVEYGKYLFKKLHTQYGDLIQKEKSTFNFLKTVDQHIHVEVLKLYPEAELPRFECQTINSKTMTMKYYSNHPFADLAEGLIIGCSQHFQEKIQLIRQTLPSEQDKKYVELFTLKSN